MKLTIFIGGLSGGGAERVVCNLANHMVAQGHEVEILNMSEDTPAYELNSSVTRYCLMSKGENLGKIGSIVTRVKRLKKYIKNTKTDCYLVFLPITTIMLLMFRRLIKVPVIASERAYPTSYSAKIQTLLKKFAKRTDGFVFQTEDAFHWYEAYLGASNPTVIPNAINEEFICGKFEGERQNAIVAAGRMNVQKNFGLLLRSFANIAGEFPEYNLKILGDGALLQSHKMLAAELGIADRVAFPGYVNNVGEHIKAASLFVLSSNYEGMPNALMEAMALGLPCVSTRCPCGGPAFLIQNGENGLLTDVGDEQQMTDAMRKVLSDKQLAQKLGDNASKICETLAPDKIYGQWERFIVDVCKGEN